MKKNLISFVLFIIFLTSLGAKELTLQVLDRDIEIPLEGVRVQITSSSEVIYSDIDGKAILNLAEAIPRHVITLSLPGYDNLRIAVDINQSEITAEMVLTGVIEGKELVVERAAPGKTDEKVGVSTVINAEEMDTTANMGLIEDVISAIKTLPGVGYASAFSGPPSIRGGNPDELSVILDGVRIYNPYHWGGAYSILDPNMVESSKLSHGVFSARYGQALSGILEVNSIVPDESRVRFIISANDITTTAFGQFPLGSRSGLFLGGKITYLDPMMALANAVQPTGISTAPYIRDVYGKWYVRPVPGTEIYTNLFLGTDGVGTDASVTNDGLTTHAAFDYSMAFFTGTLGIKTLLGEKGRLDFQTCYNVMYMKGESLAEYSGTKEYSDDFLATYDILDGSIDNLIFGQDSYTLPSLEATSEFSETKHYLQGKLQTEFQLSPKHILLFGAEGIYSHSSNSSSGEVWMDQLVVDNMGNTGFAFLPFKYNMEGENDQNIQSAVYGVWEFGDEKSLFQGELGVRGDHFYLWNDSESLNTYPMVNPRGTLAWTPIRNKGLVDSLSFSIGSGLYSQVPVTSSALKKEYGLEDFDLGPNLNWTNVIGTELNMAGQWKFKLEGYYKYYFNRTYIAERDLTPSDKTDAMDMLTFSDGWGYATGFDAMLQKKISRYIDGYISYSFVYSRMINPFNPAANDTQQAIYPGNEPLNSWYWPSYHRFHTLNLVLNIRPGRGLTFTISGTIASGTPKSKAGDVAFYAADYDGTVIERYSRTNEYDDNLRNNISAPIDIRMSYKHFVDNVQIEYYCGAEDVLVNLYSPKTNSQQDPFTGKTIPNSNEADFNIGFPMISIGVKVSY